MTTRLNVLFNRMPFAVEWRLLLFLVLFLDVKLYIKAVALILVYISQPKFRFGLAIKNSRLPLFYLLVLVIAILNWLIHADFSMHYSLVMITAMGFWVACILAVHQVKLFVERTSLDILHNTLLLFFVLNIAVSFFNLGAILWEIGFRNPFHYQGQYQKYFINTGDHIKGITFDSSTTNALISCLGIIYFLFRQKYLLTLACMFVLILTASNFTNVILLFVFAGLVLFKSTKEQKTVMSICMLMLVIFLAKFSPQNENYLKGISEKYLFKKSNNKASAKNIIPIRERPDSLLDTESRKEKIAVLYLDSLEREEQKLRAGSMKFKERPAKPADSIHTPAFQWKRDTTKMQVSILFYLANSNIKPAALRESYDERLPGKLVAGKESIHYFQDNPFAIMTGTGAGNFSSKLAFKATGLQIAGGYPEEFVYSHSDFIKNHFSLYSFFFTKNASSHSILNSPASVYDQLFTEYGLAGFAAFIFFYIGFFLKRVTWQSYSMALLAIMLAAFTVDYWFEQLSVVVLFELMMFMNIKEQNYWIAHA